MSILKLPAYVGIILKKNDQFLLVRRHDTDWMYGFWNFSGGLLEEHETLIEAAIREAREEVDVEIRVQHFKLVHVIQVWQVRKTPKIFLDFILWQLLGKKKQSVSIHTEVDFF